MVISVLERRGEIGLRRALGATRTHITTQFLTESALLAVLGGIVGLILGASATWIYAQAKHEPFVIPTYALDRRPGRRLPYRSARRTLPSDEGRQAQPDRSLARNLR